MSENITLPRATVQQALDLWDNSTRSPRPFGLCVAMEALRTALEQQQQAEPVAQRSDGMPTSKAERDLRRMLCIERHGGSAYMDDGEASFCGDAYYRSIDYMRESIESIRQAWYDAGVKKLSGAQPEQQAEPVAYIHRQGNHWEVSERCLVDDEKTRGWTEEPLYTTPTQRKPLTPREYNIALALVNIQPSAYEAVTRAIEAAHGIGEKK